MTDKTEKPEKTVDKKSIHRIELVPGRYIEPNTVFACPVSQVKWLTENGAITDVKRLTVADASAKASPPVVVVAEEEVPLDEMTDAALAAEAVKLGVKVGKAKRATVLKRLKTAQAAVLVDEDDPSGLV